MESATIDVHKRTADSALPGTLERVSSDELRKIDAYWRARNYLAAGMIYLLDNPLLRENLKREHIKNRLSGIDKPEADQWTWPDNPSTTCRRRWTSRLEAYRVTA